MRITNEEKKIIHLCVTCDKEFLDYDIKHRKFCSRKCYYKSLKKHGKTLYFIYGRKALIRLQNLRDEAYRLGMRRKKLDGQLQYWWKTTKKMLEAFIIKAKRLIYEKKNQSIIDYEYGPRPAFVETGDNISYYSSNNNIPP